VDENNTVNSKDVTILKRYIAKWPGVTLHLGNADVNGDGSVNSKDVTILKRYIAKWPGVMLGPEA
jgi:endoglucanase